MLLIKVSLRWEALVQGFVFWGIQVFGQGFRDLPPTGLGCWKWYLWRCESSFGHNCIYRSVSSVKHNDIFWCVSSFGQCVGSFGHNCLLDVSIGLGNISSYWKCSTWGENLAFELVSQKNVDNWYIWSQLYFQKCEFI